MSRKNLLRIAAFFVLFTFAGHTIGALSGPPPDQSEVQSVYAMMKQTQVIFPVGSPTTIADLVFGVNVCLSIYLFVAGFILILFSGGAALGAREKNILMLNNVGLLATSITSFLFIFPVPGVCTLVGGVLGFLALKSK